MVHRSIKVESMSFKPSRDFSKIKKKIIKDFGDDVFLIEFEKGFVVVSGDLHDYKVRERLFTIITGRKVGG